MHVVRGSVSQVDRDRQVTREVVSVVERTGRPAVRVWTPPRQVAFGRRDASTEGYARARQMAADCGYVPVERRVGGRAVAHTGETIAFVHAVPTAVGRSGIQDRYEAATATLESALRATGADVRRGEPPESFCPGDHSLQADGKVTGIAQRVERDVAVVAGCVVVAAGDERDIAGVLDPIYGVLDVGFDSATVGSVESAGGPGDSEAVAATIETAVVGDSEVEPLSASSLVDTDGS